MLTSVHEALSKQFEEETGSLAGSLEDAEKDADVCLAKESLRRSVPKKNAEYARCIEKELGSLATASSIILDCFNAIRKQGV